MTGDFASLDSAPLDPCDPRPEVRARVHDWLALQARLAFRPVEAAVVLAACADPQRALALAGARRPASRELERARARLAALAALLVPLPAEPYPPRLRRLADAPPLLLVRGDPAALLAPAVAVVGARAPTAYGREVARALGAALARAGRVVISGLARGIDGAAHAGALEAGGASVAVLGCGPDRVYPAEHAGLARALIEQGGALVSEFPPGTPPRAPNFPLRNRLISALAEAVIVVEARARSGSLVTARLAAEQGVDVLAVPGPIDAATSRGTNRLLYDGATPVLGVEEALLELGCAPGSPGLNEPEPPEPGGTGSTPGGSDALPAPGGLGARALAALADQPLTRDALGRRLGCTPEALAPALLELELAGRVAQERDGRLRPVGGASPLRGPRL